MQEEGGSDRQTDSLMNTLFYISCHPLTFDTLTSTQHLTLALSPAFKADGEHDLRER